MFTVVFFSVFPDYPSSNVLIRILVSPGKKILEREVCNFSTIGVIVTVPLTAYDLSKQFFGGVSEERRTAHQKLIQDDSHGPPVHWFPITLSEYHLRGDIFRCTTHLAGKHAEQV